MRNRLKILLVLSCAALPSACGSIFGEDCLSIISPAIVVSVTNAPTGVAPSSGVTLVIRGAGYDSVTWMTQPGFIQAGRNPGKYTVVVRQPGYREYSQSNVRVPSVGCNQPQTVRLSAILQPL